MRAASALAVLFLAPLIAACASGGDGYPSLLPRPAEQERVILAPGDGEPVGLSAEEEAAIAADLERMGKRLAAINAELRAAEAELAAALGVRGPMGIGSDAWSRAQMALSRYDDARAPLAVLEADSAALQIQVDSLPEGNASRIAVRAITTELDATRRRTAAVAADAERRLS